MLLGQVLSETRKKSPDKIALWFGPGHWTYADLDDATSRIAAALLQAGVRAGDRVALFLPNCPQLLLSYFACFKIGAINVPLNYRYRQEEARYALEHSGASTLIVHQVLRKEVEGLPLPSLGVTRRYLAAGDDGSSDFVPFDRLLNQTAATLPAPTFDTNQPAAILYTSGTTARPKGVTYTHQTLWHNCVIQTAGFQFTAADVHLVSTAACHAAAFTGQLLPGIYSGGTCVLTHLPTPEQVVEAIEQRRASRVQMLPATLEDLVEYLEHHPSADLSSWRCCTAGGDIVPVDLHERFRKATGFEITELYGMTEVLSCITNPPFGPKKRGAIGRPVPQTRVRLVDENDRDVPAGQTGELLVQSPSMLVGYWNDADATAEALGGGWFHTGDVACQDADGDYWFVGRKKEIIIHGGSNIAPQEVEEVLDQHPAVRISCVVGVPNRHFGELVAAYVAIRYDVKVLPSAREIRQFVAQHIAAYKVPERVMILKDLPLTATGKVDRKKLHARVIADLGGGPAAR
jgi:long-chain acyl-CoA synthetase